MAGATLLDFFDFVFSGKLVAIILQTQVLKIEHRWTSHVAIFQNLEVGCFQREVSSGLALESPQDSNLEVGGLTMFVRFFGFFRLDGKKLKKNYKKI